MDYLPYIVIAATLLFAAMPLRAIFAAKRQEGRSAPRVPEVEGSGTEVFYFYGEHCGPCRAMAPLMERYASTGNLTRIDVAVRPDLARAFGVTATPAFVRVVDGTIDKTVLGTLTEKRLQGLLAE